MSETDEFTPSAGQLRTLEVLVDLIGMTGVCRRPPQGKNMVLDLLPASHVAFGGGPFCVRVTPSGQVFPISDEEAGLDGRPTMAEAMESQAHDLFQRFGGIKP